MALRRDAVYPGRFKAASDIHPQGAFKNRTSDTSNDGSYLEEQWLNDWSGFFESLLDGQGITPNGDVDEVGASQYFDAFIARINSISAGIFAGQSVPVGVPMPWPTSSAPVGYLAVMGQPFSGAAFPVLASVYPSLILPDLRGEFIRGWDNGRGIDSGRTILSTQTDEFASHSHIVFGITHGGAEGGGRTPLSESDNNNVNTGIRGGTETRPRNIAFNYIVRAA